MSKAILVIDAPNDYPLNKLRANIDLFGLNVYEYRNQEIRELPQKKEVNQEYATSTDRKKVFEYAYCTGFNACLKDILGEQNND